MTNEQHDNITEMIRGINNTLDELCRSMNDTITDIADELYDLENEVESQRDDVDCPAGYESILALLPPDASKLSEGEMMDLEQAIKGWRFRNGYSIVP